MKDMEHNGNKQIAATIGNLVLRSLNVIFAGIAAFVALWIKANVPEKQDFRNLQAQVFTIERSVNRMADASPDVNKRIDDFEQRIRALEKKFPTRITP